MNEFVELIYLVIKMKTWLCSGIEPNKYWEAQAKLTAYWEKHMESSPRIE